MTKIIQSTTRHCRGKLKFLRPENKYKHSHYHNKQPVSSASFKDCFEQEDISSPKQYQTKEKKKSQGGVNDADGNYLDDSDSDSDELTSVLNMRKDVKLEYHKGLGSVLKKHVFVGIVDDDYSLIQYETKLFILNHSVLAEEYFIKL